MSPWLVVQRIESLHGEDLPTFGIFYDCLDDEYPDINRNVFVTVVKSSSLMWFHSESRFHVLKTNK